MASSPAGPVYSPAAVASSTAGPVYSPAAAVASSPAAAAAREAEAETPFYIQVGAFALRRNAEKLQRRLNALVDGIRIAPAVVGARRMYRVQIGPLTDITAADRIVAALDGYGVREHSISLE